MRKIALICVALAGCLYDYDALRGRDGGVDSIATGAGGRAGAAGGRGGSSGVAGSGGGAGTVTGAAGTLGVAGTTGAAGTVGVAGTTGAAGRGGTTGSAGTTGAAGTIGAAGRGGTTGSAGTIGAAGTLGVAGTTGRGGTTGSGTSLTVKLKGDGAASVQWIIVAVQITNNGTAAIPISDLAIRYWYTYDAAMPIPQLAACNYVSLPSGSCSSVLFTGAPFVALIPPRTNADYWFEITFAATAGSLAPNATAELQLMFRKNDFSNYTQTNDYSYNGATAFMTTTKVTVNRAGFLVYGMEPQ